MEQLLKEMLVECANKSVTDIHITAEDTYGLIRIRQFGKMQFFKEIELDVFKKLINYLKFIAELDTNEHRIAQSGRIEFVIDNIELNLRISTLPTSLMNEIVVIRILNRVKHVPSNKLFRRGEDYGKIRQLCQTNHGLILFTGPTGSGKSTVMFRLLDDIVKGGETQVITIEDPIEFELPNIIQVEVNEKANLSYEAMLRGIMRCDPDVIMFGEIRDSLVAESLVKASLSGHLVYSTFHSNSAYGALLRLKEYGIYHEELIESIHLIINQRIIHDENRSFIIYEYLQKEQIKEIIKGNEVSYHTLKDELEQLYKEGLIEKDTYETNKAYYE